MILAIILAVIATIIALSAVIALCKRHAIAPNLHFAATGLFAVSIFLFARTGLPHSLPAWGIPAITFTLAGIGLVGTALHFFFCIAGRKTIKDVSLADWLFMDMGMMFHYMTGSSVIPLIVWCIGFCFACFAKFRPAPKCKNRRFNDAHPA
jgi:hypothetical protein